VFVEVLARNDGQLGAFPFLKGQYSLFHRHCVVRVPFYNEDCFNIPNWVAVPPFVSAIHLTATLL
jgi:hypothetical protein